MTRELLPDTASSELFLRALREYSEACEAPSLHHDCPFAIEISNGLRGCGEECMDLLGSYGAPNASHKEALPDGLTITRNSRPRPRHSAVRPSPAFDARGTFLSESESSNQSQWSLQSLIYRLKELVQTAPWNFETDTDTRKNEIRGLLQLIQARGLNLEEHLEVAIRFAVRMSIFRELLSSQVEIGETTQEVLSWQNFIEEEGAKFSRESVQSEASGQDSLPTRTIIVLGIWSDCSHLDQILDWSIPSGSFSELINMRNTSDIPVEKETKSADGRWLFDRFTETYLERWDTNSLCREWSFIHGQKSAPCSPFELKSREVKVAQLSAEMSDRLVKKISNSRSRDFSRPESQDLTPMFTSQLVQPAANFLKEGRFTEARALFEAILQMDPESSDANNNLGFCLLPENPELALERFEKAERLAGYRNPVLAVNMMLANASLGRISATQDIGRDTFGLSQSENYDVKYQNTDDAGIFLWNIDSLLNPDTPKLDEVSDVIQYAQALMARTRF
jgi:hypothetical protein